MTNVISLQQRRAVTRAADFKHLLTMEHTAWAVTLLNGINTLFQQCTGKADTDFLGAGIVYKITVGNHPNPVRLEIWATDTQEPEDERFITIERFANPSRSHYQTQDRHTLKANQELSSFVEVWCQRRQGSRSPEEIASVPVHSLVPPLILATLSGMMSQVRTYDFDHECSKATFRIVSEVSNCEYLMRVNLDAIKRNDGDWNGEEGE